MVMVFKQVFVNVYEFLAERYRVRRKLRNVHNLFQNELAQADLALT